MNRKILVDFKKIYEIKKQYSDDLDNWLSENFENEENIKTYFKLNDEFHHLFLIFSFLFTEKPIDLYMSYGKYLEIVKELNL